MPPDLTRFLQLDPTLKPILSTPLTRISKSKEGPKRPSYIPRLFTPEIARLWMEEKKNKKKRKTTSCSRNQNDAEVNDPSHSVLDVLSYATRCFDCFSRIKHHHHLHPPLRYPHPQTPPLSPHPLSMSIVVVGLLVLIHLLL